MMKIELSRLTFAMGACMSMLALAVAPHTAQADAKAVQAELQKLSAGKNMSQGGITIKVPDLAENERAIPLNIEVDSPMTDDNYVKAVYVFADGNPEPNVLTYHFTPMSGRASASTRIRLARQRIQTITVVAEMSDGSLRTANSEVKLGLANPAC